jgi:hypothetical protein
VASRRDALEIPRGAFHFRALPQDGLTGRRGGESVRRSVQQRHAQALFKQCDAPPNCHMTHAKSAGGARQAACARHREKEAHIAPLPGARILFIYGQHMRTNERCKRTVAAPSLEHDRISSAAMMTKSLVWGFRLVIAAQAIALLAQATLVGACSQDARALSPHTCL